METLYLLIPLSAALALAILGLFAWALQAGQFDDLERQGERLLQADDAAFDAHQGVPTGRAEQSS